MKLRVLTAFTLILLIGQVGFANNTEHKTHREPTCISILANSESGHDTNAIKENFQLAVPLDVPKIKYFIDDQRSLIGIRSDRTASGNHMYEDFIDFNGNYGENSGGQFFVYSVAGKIVGTAGFLKIDDITCELKKVYVDQEYSRMGIGKKLLDFVIKRARQFGYGRIVLQTRQEMEAARRFYLINGFEEIKSSSPETSAIWMSRDIRNPDEPGIFAIWMSWDIFLRA